MIHDKNNRGHRWSKRVNSAWNFFPRRFRRHVYLRDLSVMRDILQSRYLRRRVAHKQLARTSLRWLIFPRLVLHILFQLQFELSHQYEIYHRHKRNFTELLHHIFFQKSCYHGNDITHSVAPPESKAIVLSRERVGEIFSNSHITCY